MTSPFKILVVDDFAPWRRLVSLMFQTQRDFEIVGEAADGLHAVQRARELRPHLILMDIYLPRLDGIQAARRIGHFCPETKILFASVESSLQFAREALRTVGHGYLVKSDAGKELIPAMKALARDKKFVSAGLDFECLVSSR